MVWNGPFGEEYSLGLEFSQNGNSVFFIYGGFFGFLFLLKRCKTNTCIHRIERLFGCEKHMTFLENQGFGFLGCGFSVYLPVLLNLSLAVFWRWSVQFWGQLGSSSVLRPSSQGIPLVLYILLFHILGLASS